MIIYTTILQQSKNDFESKKTNNGDYWQKLFLKASLKAVKQGLTKE